MKDDIYIAELLCSRLCHDIIAPLSAVNTGLELQEEMDTIDDSDREDVQRLIKQSTKSALARLSFYRASFGRGGSEMTFEEIKKLIESCDANNKIQFAWNNIEKSHTSLDGWGRIILNLLMVISDFAPRGGQLTIDFPNSEEKRIELNLTANPMIISDEIIMALKGEIALSDLSPRNVQAYLVFQLLKELQAKLSFSSTENKMQVEVTV